MSRVFEETLSELRDRGIGIHQISMDLYQTPDKRNYVKSPVTPDKNRSCRLYPGTDTFCDFANGNRGGDAVAFVAYVKGLNNWEGAKLLAEHYGLSGADERSRDERRRMIQKQKQEEQEKAKRQQAFHNALFALINDLKAQEDNYKVALNKAEIEPFSDLWAYILNELQRISYRLDILCCADMGTYRRMKSNSSLGLSSDRPEWLLDALDILAEEGYFTATAEELSEIKTQRSFESQRKPGADRRDTIEWK